jgi:hypothetical protein
MKTPQIAVCALVGLSVGYLVAAWPALSPVASQTAMAQQPPGKKIFSSLRVGQMVEVRSDNQLVNYVTVYDAPEDKDKMNKKITEIGDDYMAVTFAGAVEGQMIDVRIPVYSLVSLVHVRSEGAPGKAKKGGK